MATQPTPILVAKSKRDIVLYPRMANRHGLIAGATGTGKTVTLQTLAENFSARGIPVFMADVKGDLAGMSQAVNVTSVPSTNPVGQALQMNYVLQAVVGASGTSVYAVRSVRSGPCGHR